MNKVILMGRLTKDPEVRGEGDKKVVKFTVAVDRPTKEKNADFIGVTAFGGTANLIATYFMKGSKILLDGSIRTGSYTKQDGTKVYTTEVIAERIEFVESRKDQGTAAPAQAQSQDEGWMHIPENADELLPFA